MPASEARLIANRSNALKSTGPKTPEGKEASRANAYKHGMTGAGVVMPREQAAEVDRLAESLRRELQAPGEAGAILARQAAVMAVRMDRCFKREAAAMTLRMRRAIDECVPPEGADPESAALMRDEAANAAMFDASKDEVLARRYEAAAERNFLRALKEIRLLRKAKPAEPAREGPPLGDSLASFLPPKAEAAGLDAVPPPLPARVPVRAADPPLMDVFSALRARVDVPIAIGRRR